MTVYGNARVSTTGQTLATQKELLMTAGNLLRIIDLIGKDGEGSKSLADPWADTTTTAGRLMVTVLAGIAEFKRCLILQRTAVGRAAGEPMREIAPSYAVGHSTISRLKTRHAAEF